MKKIIPILTLAIGVGIGWGIATYQSQQSFEKRFQEVWDQEFQDFVKEIGTIGAILEETMTEDEIRELLESMVELGKKMSTDETASALGQAHHAFLIKKYLETGDIDSAISSIQSRLEYFVNKYDAGDFEGNINEEMASALAGAIKYANQALQPTVKTPIESGNEQGTAAEL